MRKRPYPMNELPTKHLLPVRTDRYHHPSLRFGLRIRGFLGHDEDASENVRDSASNPPLVA